jgi:hypothetical protein
MPAFEAAEVTSCDVLGDLNSFEAVNSVLPFSTLNYRHYRRPFPLFFFQWPIAPTLCLLLIGSA